MPADARDAYRADDQAPPNGSSVGPCLAEQVFAGRGEMAGLIRTTDWSKTPLGPIESWPPSLRTAVSICLDSRHPIVLWWGPERWMFYNDAYRPMLGESKHPQFLGRPGQECWAEIWDVIGPMMDQVIETGEATWSEDLLLLMLRNGYREETYFTFSYSPIRDETGRPSGIFNACTESTPRVLDRRRLKTMREMTVEARTAREAARLCGDILGHNPRDIPFALVYLFDGARKHLHLAGHAGLEPGTQASPRTVDMAGKDALGWPLARVARDGRPELLTDLAQRFDGLPTAPWDEPPRQAMLLPIARPGAQGASGVLVLGVSPRRSLDDDYRGFFDLVAGHVATAVSSARAFEVERERAEKFAELDRVKTTFFSNVSHEFRTPLTLMLGPLEEALGDSTEPLGPRQKARFTLARDNALRLLKLVNALLDFSRFEAGRLRASYAPLDVATFTAELAGMFQSAIEKAGLRLVIDCPRLSEPAWVDRDMWEKIVPNLVSNAFKYTLQGEVAVRLSEESARFVLEVADTGVGIPESELPRIFERFHRVAGTVGRTHEGTGIGLSLVRELVALHGGHVAVESEVGRGTTFRVGIPKGFDHLPADAVSPVPTDPRISRDATAHVAEAGRWAAGSGATTRALHVPSTGTGPRPRVLVVDDNSDLREYISALLSPSYDVSTAVDGVAALEAVHALAPTVVISDVMMPRLDGFGLVRALREDPSTAALPVILLSARAGEEAAIAGLDAGSDDYLAKPFSARELLARVRTHVVLAGVRREWIAKLERANRELDAFSYSVSHDLRAPLRAIDGFSRALVEDCGAALDERGQAYVERICRNVALMTTLIDDLLELARISRTAMSTDTVDLSGLAAEVVADLRRAHGDRTVDVEIAEGLLARGDRRLLQVVLVNLIGNAWKFTSRSARARIEFGRHPGDEPTFFVRDNGAGFDMQYASRLFGAFQRLHSSREFEGTGVGLATVQRIVARHGGRVWAEAAVGLGATFFFSLPARPGVRT
jgi:signal transduction histidine kinase